MKAWCVLSVALMVLFLGCMSAAPDSKTEGIPTIVKKSFSQDAQNRDTQPNKICEGGYLKGSESDQTAVCKLIDSKRVDADQPSLQVECVGVTGNNGCFSCTFECWGG
jgi:hypothetical protein